MSQPQLIDQIIQDVNFMTNYLDKGTRPDIIYATYQCARFCEDPKEVHGKAVEYIVGYLKKTRKQGIVLKPDKSKLLEVYVDADFSGNWSSTIL